MGHRREVTTSFPERKEELSITIFVCKNCGKIVIPEKRSGDIPDKRRVFCSAECEKSYWKKPRGTRLKRYLKAEKVYENLEACISGMDLGQRESADEPTK